MTKGYGQNIIIFMKRSVSEWFYIRYLGAQVHKVRRSVTFKPTSQFECYTLFGAHKVFQGHSLNN